MSTKKEVEFARNGALIAMEGLDGAGKSTVADETVQRLLEEGLEVVVTNWNSTSEIYNLIVDLSASDSIDSETRGIMFAAELAARVHFIVKPALEAGKLVIATKYVSAAIAHAVARGGDETFFRQLYHFAPEADLTVYLDVDPFAALARKTEPPGFFEAGMDCFEGKSTSENFGRYQKGEFDRQTLETRFLEFQSALQASYRKSTVRQTSLRIGQGLSPEEATNKICRKILDLEMLTRRP